MDERHYNKFAIIAFILSLASLYVAVIKLLFLLNLDISLPLLLLAIYGLWNISYMLAIPLIVSITAYFAITKKQERGKSLAIVAIILSTLPIIITAYQYISYLTIDKSNIIFEETTKNTERNIDLKTFMQNTERGEWRTYRNEGSGFTFDYPANFSRAEAFGGVSVYVPESQNDFDDFSFRVIVFEKDSILYSCESIINIKGGALTSVGRQQLPSFFTHVDDYEEDFAESAREYSAWWSTDNTIYTSDNVLRLRFEGRNIPMDDMSVQSIRAKILDSFEIDTPELAKSKCE